MHQRGGQARYGKKSGGWCQFPVTSPAPSPQCYSQGKLEEGTDVCSEEYRGGIYRGPQKEDQVFSQIPNTFHRRGNRQAFDSSKSGYNYQERSSRQNGMNPHPSRGVPYFSRMVRSVSQSGFHSSDDQVISRGRGHGNQRGKFHSRGKPSVFAVRDREDKQQDFDRTESAAHSTGSACSRRGRSLSKPMKKSISQKGDAYSKLLNLSSLCNRSDIDLYSNWLKVELPKLLFYMSTTDPVVTFNINQINRELRNFSHYHIAHPLFGGSHQVGRKIKPVTIPKKAPCLKDSFNFTVVSYNVLSDELLWQNRSLYGDCPNWTLRWSYRKYNLLKEIRSYNADIICLQEVQANHYGEWFLPEFKKNGYFGIFKQRSGDKPDGCATFFNDVRFHCRAIRPLEYRIPQHALMDRDNIGLITALEPKVAGNQARKPNIFVANTHLLFNKKRGDLKLLQLAKLLAEIDEMAKVVTNFPHQAPMEDVYNPVIICGDFNSTPFSPLYEFLSTGKLKYEGLSRVHISGQTSRAHFARNDTYFRKHLIPEEMNLSNLCQKKLSIEGEKRDPIGNSGVDDTNDSLDNDECSVVAEIIQGKTVIMEEPGVLKHLIRLQSVYDHFLEDGKDAVTSTQGTVDYIFYSQGMEKISREKLSSDDEFIEFPRKQLYLTGVLPLLSSEAVAAMSSVPNPILSSDHLALLATFLC